MSCLLKLKYAPVDVRSCVFKDYAFLNLTVLTIGAAPDFQSNLIYEQFISNFSWVHALPGPH